MTTTATAAGLISLSGAIDEANLGDMLDTAKDVTIFAPTNEAFQAIGSALGDLSAEQLTDILSYHVVMGTVAYSTDLTNDQKIRTEQGEEITISIDNGTVFANGARVIIPNVLVANGVVHVIDQYVYQYPTLSIAAC